MSPTEVEEEERHKADSLATRDTEHLAPTGWMSLFLQAMSDSECSPLLQKDRLLLCQTVLISSAPHPGEASIPLGAEEHLLSDFSILGGELPLMMIVEEETK